MTPTTLIYRTNDVVSGKSICFVVKRTVFSYCEVTAKRVNSITATQCVNMSGVLRQAREGGGSGVSIC